MLFKLTFRVQTAACTDCNDLGGLLPTPNLVRLFIVVRFRVNSFIRWLVKVKNNLPLLLYRQHIESMHNVINALQEGRPQPALDGGRSSWMSSLWGIFGGGNNTNTEQAEFENEAPKNEDTNDVQNGGVTDVPVSDFPNDFEGLRHRHSLPYPPQPLYRTGPTVYPPSEPLTPTTSDIPSFVDDRSQFDSMERSFMNVNLGVLVYHVVAF